ncbi:HSP20-like chaperone [Fimicolochytrium jonesii]|uniref:HSP20-like chaperone n=1 Tax=Fimicolochytrium jonesii TaxID=1396493 RepID=UPI0022FF3838|nr:HSP20-like chaperone [Fimicolochytrium jonesii]KAI8824415.1 HSP20-like chaperone [Fimicolochytrium jonesii]
MMTAATNTLIPEVLWAQRTDELFVTINVSDVEHPEVNLSATGLKFTGASHGKEYSLDLEFFKEVDIEASKQNITARNLSFVIAKKATGEEYWPRLTKEKAKYHWLKTDFSKWKDEDEVEEEVAAGGPGGAGGFDGIDFSQFQNMAGGMGGMGGMPGMDFGANGMDLGGEQDSDDEEEDGDLPKLESVESV